MASTSFFARVTLPALLRAQPQPLAIACRVRHGAARGSYRRVVAVARPPRRTLGSVRAAALRTEEAQIAVPSSVPVRVTYEVQLVGPCASPSYTLHSVLTEGEFGGARHPAGAMNIPYMYSTGTDLRPQSLHSSCCTNQAPTEVVALLLKNKIHVLASQGVQEHTLDCRESPN